MELVPMFRLSYFRAQKFAARRHVVKSERTSTCVPGARRVAHNVNLPPLDDDLSPRNRIRFASRQAETRHTGDARQRFATETESADRFKSDTDRILLVACRSSESKASSRSIPEPSSITRIREIPRAG